MPKTNILMPRKAYDATLLTLSAWWTVQNSYDWNWENPEVIALEMGDAYGM